MSDNQSKRAPGDEPPSALSQLRDFKVFYPSSAFSSDQQETSRSQRSSQSTGRSSPTTGASPTGKNGNNSFWKPPKKEITTKAFVTPIDYSHGSMNSIEGPPSIEEVHKALSARAPRKGEKKGRAIFFQGIPVEIVSISDLESSSQKITVGVTVRFQTLMDLRKTFHDSKREHPLISIPTSDGEIYITASIIGGFNGLNETFRLRFEKFS